MLTRSRRGEIDEHVSEGGVEIEIVVWWGLIYPKVEGSNYCLGIV